MKNSIVRYFLPLVCLILVQTPLTAQKILTLKECYDHAMVSNALANEKDAYQQIWQLKDKNLSRTWLPTLDANGSFVYNSSVIDLSEVMGSLPVSGLADQLKPMPHEQYRVTLDVNQVIYDGGATKSARELEQTTLALNQKQTESDMYKLRNQVNGFYFNLLLLDRQRELLRSYLDLVEKRMASLTSALNSGMALKQDLDVLLSEKIKLQQQLSENNIRKSAFLKILSDMTDTQIDASTQFVLPASQSAISEAITRPELQLFDLRNEQLAASLRLTTSKRLPKVAGFATLGYGNPPGNNFFRDEFAPFMVVGAGVKWNVFDWNKVRDEKKVIAIQQDMLEKRKTDLTDNLKQLLDSKQAEIVSLESLLATDDELIAIRKRITLAAESRYENGTITATEYLNELNAEKQALINREIHTVTLGLARVEYLTICGQAIQ
jgi:outer membrane protein TolC